MPLAVGNLAEPPVKQAVAHGCVGQGLHDVRCRRQRMLLHVGTCPGYYIVGDVQSVVVLMLPGTLHEDLHHLLRLHHIVEPSPFEGRHWFYRRLVAEGS